MLRSVSLGSLPGVAHVSIFKFMSWFSAIYAGATGASNGVVGNESLHSALSYTRGQGHGGLCVIAGDDWRQFACSQTST